MPRTCTRQPPRTTSLGHRLMHALGHANVHRERGPSRACIEKRPRVRHDCNSRMNRRVITSGVLPIGGDWLRLVGPMCACFGLDVMWGPRWPSTLTLSSCYWEGEREVDRGCGWGAFMVKFKNLKDLDNKGQGFGSYLQSCTVFLHKNQPCISYTHNVTWLWCVVTHITWHDYGVLFVSMVFFWEKKKQLLVNYNKV